MHSIMAAIHKCFIQKHALPCAAYIQQLNHHNYSDCIIKLNLQKIQNVIGS